MKIVAFDLRTGGPRNYEHGIIDVGAVVYRGDEIEREFYSVLAPHPHRSYRAFDLAASGLTLDRLNEIGKDYTGTCEELCAFLLEHGMDGSIWAFGSVEKAGYIQSALGRSYGQTIQAACAISLFQIMQALGAHTHPAQSEDGLMRFLGEAIHSPEDDALTRAKACAIAVEKLQYALKMHYSGMAV